MVVNSIYNESLIKRSEIVLDFDVHDSVGWTSRDYGVHHYIGIVAFIDVLGMKGMSERCKPAQIVNKWKKVIRSFSKVLEAGYFFLFYYAEYLVMVTIICHNI
ncbi:MAG: hypothetical protein WA667_11350 [Candidatus Nitrosopolaris sp.]